MLPYKINYFSISEIMKKVNSKYVELLSEAFEKYRNIEVIEKTVTKCDDNDEILNNIPKVDVTSISLKKKKKDAKEMNSEDKSRKNRKVCKIKFFLPEEDELILKAIRKDDYKIVDIAKQLNRGCDSIIWRIKKLKMTGTSRRRYKNFDLKEDCVLIDAAVDHLRVHKCLENTIIENLEKIAANLKRDTNSIRFRWEKLLRVWLLRYYKKTLNLEIRPMLANVIAENYETMGDIDWKGLLKYKEFSGHSDSSLRTVFYAHILPGAVKRLNIDKFELTLKEIAGDAESNYRTSEVSKKVEKRQRDIIYYFETLIKQFGLKDFL